MQHLSALDAAFLALEDTDPHAGLHIGSVGLFEGPAPTHEQALAVTARKLRLVPKYRQRLQSVPFGLGPPVWVDDPHFDLGYHLRRTALPAPGSETLLRRLVGRLMSARMDRDKPLWEAWFIEGLSGGRWALLSKVHHCLADGISGTELLATLFDLSPDAAPPPELPWEPRPVPGPLPLLASATDVQLRRAGRLVTMGLTAARTPLTSALALRTVLTGTRAYVGAFRPTGATTLRGPLTGHRRVRWARVSFDDVSAVRHAFGGTVNDLALAAATNGLRELMRCRGERTERRSVRTLVPVSVWSTSPVGAPGNQVSALLVDLPVDLADPLAQLRTVQQRLAAQKRSGEARAGRVVTAVADAVPYPVLAPTLRLAFRLPQVQLTTVTTNVPGPDFPLYVAGRRMLEAFPYVPLGDRLRVGIAMFSYCGTLAFGVTADAGNIPEADAVVAGVEDSVRALTSRTGSTALTNRPTG